VFHNNNVFPARLSGFFVSFLFGKVDFFIILRQYKSWRRGAFTVMMRLQMTENE